MPFRSRPPDPDVTARVAALLLGRSGAVPREGGWLPEQPAECLGSPELEAPAEREGVAERDAPAELQRPEGADPPHEEAALAPTGADIAPGPTSVRALLASGRLDPGRRGVMALAVVGVVAGLVAAVVLLRSRPSEQPLAVPAVAGSVMTSTGPELVVDVAGKVRKPGLVRLPAGARVDDALRAAGGVLPGVSTGVLNLARKVADGEQVLVGVEGSPAGTAAGAGGAAAGGLLDLNAATATDLDALPGIGPVLADRIVSWRTEHGRFASVDQLREVSGIGESKYQTLKSKVRI